MAPTALCLCTCSHSTHPCERSWSRQLRSGNNNGTSTSSCSLQMWRGIYETDLNASANAALPAFWAPKVIHLTSASG